MKDEIEREEETGIIYLDLTGEDELEELDQEGIETALTSPEFQYIITEHLFTNLVEAITQRKNSFIAFRVPKQEEDYILEENQYKNLLNTILKMAEREEDYNKCAAVKKLIEAL